MKISRRSTVPCLGALALIADPALVHGQTYYSATYIEMLRQVGQVTGINDRGQLVGQAGSDTLLATNIGPYVTGANGFGTNVFDFGYVGATAINDSGQVLVALGVNLAPAIFVQYGGYVTGPNGVGKTMLEILPGGNETYPAAINSSGQITGYSGYSDTSGFDQTPTFEYAFITDPNGKGIRNLGVLSGAQNSEGLGINDKGQVTGGSGGQIFMTGPNGVGMRKVNGLNGYGYGVSINASGQIAGQDNEYHSFLTGANGEGAINLGLLPGCNTTDSYSVPSALNDSGEVVGSCQAGYSSLAYLYSHGELQDLNKLIDPKHPLPPGTVLTLATAISDNGKIAVMGSQSTGPDSELGSLWILTPCPQGNQCPGKSDDILWRSTSGEVVLWSISGGKVTASAYLGNPGADWSIVGTGDFAGFGESDILWRNKNGDVVIWGVNNGSLIGSTDLGVLPTSWTVAAIGDFNGDRRSEIVWHNTDGDVVEWFINQGPSGDTQFQVTSSSKLASIDSSWTAQGTGDMNGDGNADIVWRNSDGNVVVWFLNGTSIGSSADLGIVPAQWTLSGVADFDGDGKDDVLWHDTNGNVVIWLMNGGTISSSVTVGTIPTTWSIAATGDYNGDGKADILWRNTNGDTALWYMNGATISSSSELGTVSSTQWNVVR